MKTPTKKENCKICQFEGGKHSQGCSKYTSHCYKCHKDFSAPHDTIYCIERVKQNRDGGSVSCGRIYGKECEFENEPRLISTQIDCLNCGKKATPVPVRESRISKRY